MTDHRRRERHPARSARILATGAAISATLGLTSAFRIAEVRALDTESTGGNQAPQPLPGADTTAVTAPSAPAPAAPPATAAPVATTAAPAPVAEPVVVAVPESQPQWTPPQTSGSS